jgi:hypothetical protein
MLCLGKILDSIHLQRARPGPNGRTRLHTERLAAQAFLAVKSNKSLKNSFS